MSRRASVVDDVCANATAVGAQPWEEGPSKPLLTSERVDVWRVGLDCPSSAFSSSILSADEVDRATRFRFAIDGLRFAHCRSALRSVLGRYLQVSPADIHFEYQPCGKPEVSFPQNPAGLRFNVSHSGSLALIAVGTGHRIGIDIEAIRNDIDAEILAKLVFSPRELAGFQSLPKHLRVKAFFQCWTRKESYLKAIGDGLSFPTEEFSVTTHPERAPALVEVRGDMGIGKRWYLVNLGKIDGHCATLTVEGTFSVLGTYFHRWCK